jgi:RNA polymerase sigma-70 factor, ECF subfamily
VVNSRESLLVDASSDPLDSELVARARGGEREAFGLLYRRHQAFVYRFARGMTGSTALAEDVVQDVFLTLMRDLERYDPQLAPLRTYLFGIARNLARSKSRGLWRLLSLDEAAEAVGQDDPSAALASTEESRHLRSCLGALPARYREVIVLCDLQDVNYAETAFMLGVPIGTVRSRLHRGRQLLLERLRRRQGGRIPAANRCVT